IADGVFGYINKNGEYIINPQFDVARNFSEGLACVRVGSQYGYINKKGEIVINPQYDNASHFSEGLVAVEIDGEWGFIDKKGQFIINHQFSIEPSGFYNGFAKIKFSETICEDSPFVKYNDVTWGYIDKQGKLVYKKMKDKEYIF
ncbi:MAG: WG repeat-containing protein, partial [Bacteroidales bacterium]|nr:WG repeat-containing protein [Bacteroidales bacterium]